MQFLSCISLVNSNSSYDPTVAGTLPIKVEHLLHSSVLLPHLPYPKGGTLPFFRIHLMLDRTLSSHHSYVQAHLVTVVPTHSLIVYVSLDVNSFNYN